MNPETLEKLSPEGRKQIIEMEAKLRELKEEETEIDNILLGKGVFE